VGGHGLLGTRAAIRNRSAMHGDVRQQVGGACLRYIILYCQAVRQTRMLRSAKSLPSPVATLL
jgi:hypothetical protein